MLLSFIRSASFKKSFKPVKRKHFLWSVLSFFDLIISAAISITIAVSSIAVITVARFQLHVIDNNGYLGQTVFMIKFVDQRDLLFICITLADNIKSSVCKFSKRHCVTYHSDRRSVKKNNIKIIF